MRATSEFSGQEPKSEYCDTHVDSRRNTSIPHLLALAAGLVIVLSSSLVLPPQAAVASQQAAAKYDWLQFGFDSNHSGYNRMESTLSTANVANLQKLFQVTLPSIADGAPVYLSAVKTASGTRDLLFVTTVYGHVIALDAHTGVQIWMRQNPPGSCKVGNGTDPCFTPSSPAIDPTRRFIFAYGLDGYVHKYRVASGVEITTGGWPQLTTLKPFFDKGSANLSIATAKNGITYLYVAHASFGDSGDYQGHITSINLSNNTQHVFNAMCSDQTVHFVTGGIPDCGQSQAGIWARTGVVYDSATDKIYASTGNGIFAPVVHYWANSTFALHPDGTGANGNPLDSYTPANYQQLADTDTDIGSTGPVILPTVSQRFPHMILQSGKDGVLRLLNADNLSNSAQPVPGILAGEIFTMTLPQAGEVVTAPAVWVNPSDKATWVFVANDNGLSGFKLTVDAKGYPSLLPEWFAHNGGTSPIVANGVLYYTGANPSYLGTYFVAALSPTTGSILWSDSTLVGPIHWSSPIVANGVLYVSDLNSHLTAYALPMTPTQRVVQDRANRVQYNGWQGVVDPAASGGSYRLSRVANDSAALNFVGSSVMWITRRGPEMGQAQVFIDGKLNRTVDLYSATPQSVSYAFNPSGTGAHSIMIKVLGQKNALAVDTYVVLDAFVVGGTTVEDTSCKVKYDDWLCTVDARVSGGTYRFSGTAGAMASLTFLGDSIDWVTLMGPNFGQAQVVLDNVDRGTFDLYSPTLMRQVVQTFSGLGAGVHVIQIKPLQSKNPASTDYRVAVDAFQGSIMPMSATIPGVPDVDFPENSH